MANWIIRLLPTLQPLLNRLEQHLMAMDYIQGDETRLQVLKEPGMAPTGHKWIWVMRGGPHGEKSVVLFNYDKSRGGAVAERLLDNFTGKYFQSDGYSGYDKPCALKKLVHLGCMDHARRKVVEAIKAGKAIQLKTPKGKPSVAMVLLSHIDALYRYEREWKELDDDERYQFRQEIAVPRLAKIKLWLEQKQPKVAPDTLTRLAINYLLNQWDHLVRYCEHGQLRISNILAENAVRPFAVGRRAWLFSDTPEGAKASAAMFSMIETAKANGIEPHVYLQYVLTNICTADTDEALEALMPWNMK
jgi:transposase